MNRSLAANWGKCRRGRERRVDHSKQKAQLAQKGQMQERIQQIQETKRLPLAKTKESLLTEEEIGEAEARS